MKYFVTILLSTLSFFLKAQGYNIKYSSLTGEKENEWSGNVSKSYRFKNGNLLKVAGWVEVKGRDTTISEFHLIDWSANDTIFFWGAVHSCTISKFNDTLLISELYWLAIDSNLQLIQKPFFVNEYYYDKNRLCSKKYFRNDFPRYNLRQIKIVLDQFNKSFKKENSEETLLLAYQLFWAYVSGSKQAEEYLGKFENKYGPYKGHFSGYIAEDWDHVWRTYLYYKELNTKSIDLPEN
ncbi:MAG: hypothetical protein H0X33_06130 [Taibaiella sp.]|nr:hypothetical protein [Taibaiella sp.]